MCARAGDRYNGASACQVGSSGCSGLLGRGGGGGGLSVELQDKPFCTPSSLKRDIRELEQEVSGEQALVPRECGGDFSAVLQCLC